jgi:hypothetical protein
MKLANAAIGLAAVGAGFLVARAIKAQALRAWRAGSTEYVAAEGSAPPEPSRLIGHRLANISARVAAKAFEPTSRRM